MADEEHKLHREIRAATALKQSLKDICGDDEEALRDMIEGETNLHDMIERVCLSMDEDGILLTGITARVADLAERKKRIENRIGTKRAMIEQAMVIGEIQTLERPAFTLSLRKVPAKAIIEDESLIPAKYFEPQPPVLDKKTLLADLKGEDKIPGASLSNGGIALQIRTK